MRGRKPKPTALKRLTGNPGKRKLNDKEPKFASSSADAPAWLTRHAKEEWARLAPTLVAQKVLTIADRNALAGYCAAYSDWRVAHKAIVKEGLTFTTDSGYLQQRPEVAIAQKSMALMLKFAVELGLTPAARSRLRIGGSEDPGEDKEDRDFFKDERPAGASHTGAVH